MKEHHIILIIIFLVIPAAFVGWKVQKKWSWEFSNKEYVMELLEPLEVRIVTLELKTLSLEAQILELKK